MFDNEVAIARFLLCCNTIVFIAETAFANRIRPYVSHETMYLSLFYYLVTNYASRRRSSSASSRCVWACMCWTALCSIPSMSLLSLLYNFRHSIVDCIAHDATENIHSCRFGGDRPRCEAFVVAAARQTMQEGCAPFVLGPFMGTVYAIMVFLLRFVPCFFGGIYFAFTFTEDRLYAPGTSVLTVPINQDNDLLPSLPSTTFYLASSLFLWGVFALEFASGKHADISTYTTLVFFGTLVLVQIYRTRHERMPEADRILQQLQFQGSIVLIFFVYMDFLRNAVALASTCAELVDYKVLSGCRAGDRVCLDTQNALSTTFFRQHDCPQLSLDPTRHLYFYLSQMIRLVVLAIIYPVTMVYKHIQPDGGDRTSKRRNLLKENINKTPAIELERILREAVEMDLQQQQQQQDLGERPEATMTTTHGH